MLHFDSLERNDLENRDGLHPVEPYQKVGQYQWEESRWASPTTAPKRIAFSSSWPYFCRVLFDVSINTEVEGVAKNITFALPRSSIIHPRHSNAMVFYVNAFKDDMNYMQVSFDLIKPHASLDNAFGCHATFHSILPDVNNCVVTIRCVASIRCIQDTCSSAAHLDCLLKQSVRGSASTSITSRRSMRCRLIPRLWKAYQAGDNGVQLLC